MQHRLALGLLLWATWAGAQSLDVAHAREIDLDGLRGLGPATTRTLLQERERQPFRDWRDLMQRVPGIGPKRRPSYLRRACGCRDRLTPPARHVDQAAP